jgi:hypothetical protein
MKLKLVVTKAEYDALDDARKAMYVAAGDKFVVDAEGIEDHPSVAKMKSALDGERETSRKAQREYNQLKEQIGDLDPEKARDAMRRITELADKKLIDEGQIEELFKQRLDRVTTDHANQLKAKDTLLKDTSEKLTSRQSLVRKLMLEGAITQAATGVVKPNMLPYVVGAFTQTGIDGTKWDLSDKDEIVAMKGDQLRYGKDANSPMSIEEGFDLLRTSAPDFFLPSNGAGAAGSGNRSGGGRGAFTISRADAADHMKYRAVHAEAAKAGQTVQITD